MVLVIVFRFRCTMRRVVSTATVDSSNQESNRDLFVINRDLLSNKEKGVGREEIKPKIHGVARVISHGPTPKNENNYDSTSSMSSSVSASLLTHELLSQSERKNQIQFDEINFESLKNTIQKQKNSKPKPSVIPSFQNPVQVRPENLVRKVASTVAPDSYLGFTTGSAVTNKKPRLTVKPLNNRDSSGPMTHNSTPVRKIASRPKNNETNKITTSSWRKNTRNAKKIIESEKTKLATETEVNEPEVLPEPEVKIANNQSEEQSPSEFENIIENNISPEVFGILKELQLDLVPENKLSSSLPKPEQIQKTKIKKSNAQSAITVIPQQEKKRHYKSDEVKLFMQKQKEKRRLGELKKRKEVKLKEEKMEKELAKLKDRQNKMAKRNSKIKIEKNIKLNSRSNSSKSSNFDPYAKALEIIGDLEGKSSIPPNNPSKQHVTEENVNFENLEQKSSIESSNGISIPEFKSLPSIKPEVTLESEMGTPPGILNKSNSSHISAISSNMKVENYLDKSCDNIPVKGGTNKIDSRKVEHLRLLNSLKNQSDDITKRTLIMTNKLNQIESNKEVVPPGTQLINFKNIKIPTFPNDDQQTNQEQIQVQSSNEIIDPVMKPEVPVGTTGSNGQNVYAQVYPTKEYPEPIEAEAKKFKNDSFVRARSPDELNLVNLMYQKEKERRKREKREKRKKRSKREKRESEKGLSASLISISKSQNQTSGTSVQQILSKNNYKNESHDSMTTISNDYSTPFEASSTARDKSKLTSTKIETSTFSDSSVHIAESSQILTEKNQTSNSIHSGQASISIVESSIHEVTEQAVDSSISESYTQQTTNLSETEIGEKQETTLERIINENGGGNDKMILVDQIEQKTFLNEMRQIQETGKKAAELMLKASRNMAKQADLTVTSTSEMVNPTTEANSGTILESGPLPPSSDEEENNIEQRGLITYEASSTSGTITSKISPRTETAVQTEVETETQISINGTQTGSSKVIPTESTKIYTEKAITDYSSDKFLSDESDFDKSLTMLTPSVEHRERVRRQRIPSEQSSSDLDIALDDSFTTFMKDMVDQFMTKKSNRTKFAHHMSSAKEKAAKEKKKREKEMKRYYKSKKTNFDEKMVSIPGGSNSGHALDITTGNSGSDTSFASSASTVDRVKKYFSAVNESFLTKREQELQKRRKRAEKLLKWKRRLDEQEKSIIRIEEKAGNIGQTQRNIESEISTERDLPDERSLQESEITTEDTTNHTTLSETDLDQSDVDIRIRAMKDKLRQRQHHAAKLRKQLKKTSNREKLELSGKVEALRSQIEKFDRLIAEGKQELANLSAEEWPEGGVKPRIRSPSKDSSVSSNSSINQLRISSSKIKSLTSDDSAVSPRRSPLPKVPQDKNKNSSVSSETSTIDDEYTKTFSRAATEANTEVYTEIGTEKSSEKSNSDKSENESETNNRTISPIEIKSTITDASCESSVTAETTNTISMEQNKTKDDSLSQQCSGHESKSITKAINVEPEMMVNTIVENMIDELIGDIQDKQAFKEKLKNETELEDGGIDAENILPGGAAELEDDSLIKALLDHVERQEENENRSNNQMQGRSDTPPLLPKFRSFSEVSTTARSFAPSLFFSANPLIEKIPFVLVESDKDWIEALWSFCRELTHSCLFKSKIKTDQRLNKKPWEKARFSSIPKFSKVNPKSPEELNDVIQAELKNLLSPTGPVLDERVLQKMGSKSRKDRVDLLLIGELREEEKVWTEYDEDEDQVMNILTDSIFDLLISDTIHAARQVEIQYNSST
jgi:hypothetical protein